MGTKQSDDVLYGTFIGSLAPFRQFLRIIESIRFVFFEYLYITLDASSALPSEYIAQPPWHDRQYELGSLPSDKFLPEMMSIGSTFRGTGDDAKIVVEN